MTALMHAAQHGQAECVNVLLHSGAHRELLNANGHSAAELAKEAGHNQLADVIEFFQ